MTQETQTPTAEQPQASTNQEPNLNSESHFSTDRELLQDVVAKLDRSGVPDSRFPDRRGEYWAICPFHPDHKADNFSVSERGYKCFACDASGGLHELAEYLGVAVLHASQGGNTPPPPPLNLETYAQWKRLPVDFLKGIGMTTIYVNGESVVRIPYLDLDGNEFAVRLRLRSAGNGRFRWRTGSKVHPYGLWKLEEAQAAGYIILVEGESDAQTLWSYSIPALGIPGANTWRPEWATYLEGLTVYAWQEPDGGGAEFINRIGDSWPELHILAPPPGRKDISECHILGDDVPELISKLQNQATSYASIQAKECNEIIEVAEQQAASLLANADILAEFDCLCKKMGLVGESRNAKLLYLDVTSRVLDKVISAVVKGPSSGGKSYTVSTVLQAFPPDAYYELSSMSERALAYSQEPLAHRILVIHEASGMAGDFATYLIRTLLSEGRLRYETVENTAQGLQPKLIEREGPTGLITTTTWASLHPENETRMLSLTVKDDREQTRQIMQSSANQANGNHAELPDLQPWHALQTWLRLAGERRVTIPYATILAGLVKPVAIRLRRDFGLLLNLIKTHAVLHQCQRRFDSDGSIIADLHDYAIVHGLIADLISEGVQSTVARTERETVEAVYTLYHQTQRYVSYRQLERQLNLDRSTISRRVKVAQTHGYIRNLETRQGQPAQLLPGDPLPAEELVLPTPDELAQAYSDSQVQTTDTSSLKGEGGDITPPATLQQCNAREVFEI